MFCFFAFLLNSIKSKTGVTVEFAYLYMGLLLVFLSVYVFVYAGVCVLDVID